MKFLLPLFLSVFLFSGCSQNINENSFSLKRDGNPIVVEGFASCGLKLYTTASENLDDKTELKVESGIQENSLNVNFYDLNTDKPYMKSNGGTNYLTKVDGGNVLYLFEETTFSNIVIYTLFKEKGILIMSKQYDLMGFAYGTQMIGYCN